MANTAIATKFTADSLETKTMLTSVDIKLENDGVFTVMHAVIDGDDVLVTNDPFDTDVDLPVHIFKFFTELQLADDSI